MSNELAKKLWCYYSFFRELAWVAEKGWEFVVWVDLGLMGKSALLHTWWAVVGVENQPKRKVSKTNWDLFQFL